MVRVWLFKRSRGVANPIENAVYIGDALVEVEGGGDGLVCLVGAGSREQRALDAHVPARVREAAVVHSEM